MGLLPLASCTMFRGFRKQGHDARRKKTTEKHSKTHRIREETTTGLLFLHVQGSGAPVFTSNVTDLSVESVEEGFPGELLFPAVNVSECVTQKNIHPC